MAAIETYYLIDYENVSGAGLVGCEKLNQSDHIVIFFTANAKKIDMTEIADHGDAELKMIEVPVGKQSVDIHIGSYLGYLVGKHGDGECSVVIISKDTDFDKIIKFWKNKVGLEAFRRQQIKAPEPKKQASEKVDIVKVSDTEKTEIEQETLQVVRNAGMDDSVADSVVRIAMGWYGDGRMLTEVHNKLREEYVNYLDIYNIVKPVLLKYASQTASKDKVASAASNSRTDVNNKMMQLLSQAGCPNDVATYVASAVVKNLDVKNGKQRTYRTIISKYGQIKGLEIYGHIRQHI